ENVDVPAGHLSIPHQVASGGQGRQSRTHDVGGFVLHTLWLQGADKRLIVATGIIHENDLLVILDGPIVGLERRFHNEQTAPDDESFIIRGSLYKNFSREWM